jgi:MFS family permease
MTGPKRQRAIGVLERPHPSTMRANQAFWLVAGISLLMLFAAAAASPLYRVYQTRWGFSATTITEIFAIYVVALLFTLIFLGGLSDYVGRRPVLLAGIAAQAVGCTLFLTAGGVGSLYLARIAQGIGVGLAASAIGAALVELRSDGLAPLISTSAPNLGLASGALVTSALVQYAPAPTRLVWVAILGGLVVAFVVVVAMPETRARRPGAVAALRPHVEVPPAARETFLVALPSMVAVWALGGLYLSLGPSLSAEIIHSANLLWGGLLICILTTFGALASAGLRDRDPTRVMAAGCVALGAGALITDAALINRSSVALIVGTAIAGLGFGPAFTGAYRAIVSQAEPEDRAGLIAAIFIVTYASFGGPVIIAGLATERFGLRDTALVFAAGVAALAALVAGRLSLGQRRLTHSMDATRRRAISVVPGPCTVPPCLPATAGSYGLPQAGARPTQAAPSESRRLG